MATPVNPRRRMGTRISRMLGSRESRESLRASLRSWVRTQIVRVIVGFLTVWLAGSFLIYEIESPENEHYGTWGQTLWNVWLMFFSGVEDAPETRIGRFITMIILATGVGLAGLFTATLASYLVERHLRSTELSHYEMEDHLVLCNWGPGGLSWIREVHSKIIQDKRPVVIIHDNPEQIDLPDKQDDTAFNDVYIVKGDPTNEVVLRRARIARAHSVVVLIDLRQGDHADGKSILTCIAIRNICRGENQPNIAVECQNPNNRHHLLKAGADEIISSDELGVRLLARTAIYHGMTRVYQELLTVGRDANEMYLLAVPAELVGRTFVEISGLFLRHRGDKRSALLIGLQRGEEMILNPIGNEAGPIRAGDSLILLSRVFLNPSQTLPTEPPITPAPPKPPC